MTADPVGELGGWVRLVCPEPAYALSRAPSSGRAFWDTAPRPSPPRIVPRLGPSTFWYGERLNETHELRIGRANLTEERVGNPRQHTF